MNLTMYTYSEEEIDPLSVVVVTQDPFHPSDIQEVSVKTSEKYKVPAKSHFSSSVDDIVLLSRYLYERKYLCSNVTCQKSFTSKRAYQDHRVRTHNLPRHECTVCLAAFSSYHKLVSHMEDESHFLDCEFCGQIFGSPALSSAHFSQQHRLSECQKCHYQVFGSVDLKRHERICCVTNNDSTLPHTIISNHPHEGNRGTQISEEIQPFSVCDSVQTFEQTDNHCGSTFLKLDTPENVNLPFDDESTENMCWVVFGPGANEFLETGSQHHSPSEINRTSVERLLSERCADVSQDLQRPVSQSNSSSHATLSVIQSSSKKLRYNCKYCSAKFSSKDRMKKHNRKKHVFVCFCGEKFSKTHDLIKHKRSHKSVSQSFICAICSHKAQSMHQLVIHEIRHRLDSLLKQKVESYAGKNSLKCSKCQKNFARMSKLIRHEVWHGWERIWDSYVTSKAFRMKIKEVEIRRMENDVQQTLERNWVGINNCLDLSMRETSQPVVKKPQNLETSQLHKHVKTNLKTRSKAQFKRKFPTRNAVKRSCSRNCQELVKRKSVLKESSKTENENKEAKIVPPRNVSRSNSNGISCSMSQNSDSVEESNWISYWRSYIGLSDTSSDPPWIADIVDMLRLKFKYFHTNHQEELYRQMDQLAFLIKVYRGEESHLGGASVVLERVHPALYPLPSQRKTVDNAANLSPSVNMGGVMEKASDIFADSPSSLMKSIDNRREELPSSSPLSSHRRYRNGRGAVGSSLSSYAFLRKRILDVREIEFPVLTDSVSPLRRKGSPSPTQGKLCRHNFKVPKVVVDRLVLSSEDEAKVGKINNSQPTGSTLKNDDVQRLIVEKTVGLRAPPWAKPILENISNNVSYTPLQINSKISQIVNLIKSKDVKLNRKLPVVKIRRCLD